MIDRQCYVSVKLIDPAYRQIHISDICKCSRYPYQHQELVCHGKTCKKKDSKLRPILFKNEMFSISSSLTCSENIKALTQKDGFKFAYLEQIYVFRVAFEP